MTNAVFCIWHDRDGEIQWSDGEPPFYDQEYDSESEAPCSEYYYFEDDLCLMVSLDRSPFAAPLTTRYCYVTSELAGALVRKQIPEELLLFKLLIGR